MNTKIKLNYPAMICLFVAFLCLQGCTEFEEEFDSSTAKNIFESYSQIGVKHNEGLEGFFNDVKNLHTVRIKSGNKVNLNKTDYQSLAKQSVIDFCAKNENFNTSAQLCEESLNNAWKKPLTKSNDAILRNSDIKELLEELETVIAKGGGDKNLTDFQRDLEVINQKAKNSLSETDAVAIYAATSTAFSSYQYWKENHVKWMVALNCPELLALYSDDELNRFSIKNGNLVAPGTVRLKSWWDDAWGAVGEAWDTGSAFMTSWWDNGGSDVVGADAGGAAWGAMAGAMAGLTTAGTLSGPAAIAGGITGGCGASIQETIEQWIR
ncbi:MAG: hypothetical protein LBK58_06780 [Prevotellaceae bacterium]|jgi:hypothetical protein|nr:hypothetical protein [Prevotellaceae bacterium]